MTSRSTNKAKKLYDASEEDWKRWLRKDLLNFPRIQPALIEEKKQHQKLYIKLLDEFNETKRLEQEKVIKRMDRDMNLNRILSRDEKYLNIGRNKPKSNFFSSNIMNRILQDAAKYSRNQAKNRSSDSNFSISFQDETPCPRYIRNLKRLENREFRKLLSQSSDFEHESTLSLPAINFTRDENNDENLKAESLILPKIHHELTYENKQVNEQNLIEPSEKTKIELPVLIRDQVPMLKPKIQMASFVTKKY